jgi:integrase
MATKADSTIIKRLKVGSTNYSIYKNHSSYTLAFSRRGKRVRKTFKTVKEAIIEAKTVKGPNVVTLANYELNEYQAALTLLNDYADLFDLPQRPSLDSFIREAIGLKKTENRHQLWTTKTTVQVLESLLNQKKIDGCSKQYRNDLAWLHRFTKKYPGPIDQISKQDIIEFDNSIARGRSKRRRYNLQGMIIHLFNYAREMEWLPDRRHVATILTKRGRRLGKGAGVVELWPVDALPVLLKESYNLPDLEGKNKTIAMVGLAALAGLRISEIARLEWNDVLWDTNYLRVPAHKSKNNQSARRVPLSDSLKSCLEIAEPEAEGLICGTNSPKYISNRLKKLSILAGFTHVGNGYRHTCISAWLAQGNEIGTVSLWADNSPTIIRSNYLGEITQEQGERWHSFSPRGR